MSWSNDHFLTSFNINCVNNRYKDQVFSIIHSADPFSRSGKLGHITASGLVIYGGKVLLIFHPFINQWLQPGGHIDENELPIDAAIREVYEETGLICSSYSNENNLVDIDVHEIPNNSLKNEEAHLHIDLLFRLKPLRHELPKENMTYKWAPLNRIDNFRVKRAISKLSPQGFQ